jgi:hypothetical protein
MCARQRYIGLIQTESLLIILWHKTFDMKSESESNKFSLIALILHVGFEFALFSLVFITIAST